MGYVVPAAQRLLDEVAEIAPESDSEVLDEVDGLGYHREVRIKGKGTKKVIDQGDAIEGDDRVEAVVRSSAGLKVVFVEDSRADHAHSFGLAGLVEDAAE